MIRRYDSLEAFYAGDVRRVESVEVDFGVHWRPSHSAFQTWRVSWVEATGELYAVRLSPGPIVGRGRGGPVHVLATGLRMVEDAEELLLGWTDECGSVGSLDWVRERCDAHVRARA